MLWSFVDDSDGVGIDVRGATFDITLRDNVVSNSVQGKQKVGVRIGPQADRFDFDDNTFIGLEEEVDQLSEQRESIP